VEQLELLERLEFMESTQEERRQRLDANIVVSCDQEMREAVEALAAAEERPLGAMARILIRDALRSRASGSAPEPSAA
jgi:hypothetical protein